MLSDEHHFCPVPQFRSGDYHFFSGSIGVDFVAANKQCLCLHAVSFDGFGYCAIDKNQAIPLNPPDSETLKQLHKTYCGANEIAEQDQNKLVQIILATLTANRHLIWQDAFEKYQLYFQQGQPV
ncbi:hypothetical protein A7P95_00185 [Eikenella longinqua]|uniref:Uncharacterized protein n=2 Tax=Neisseriaceae TaxID=481 RepID=A0A1A9S309_9NEIS|nr:hypothetical protein A7P95_00185 [Eikenella longinqua]